MTEAMGDLLNRYRHWIREMYSQLALLEAGDIRLLTNYVDTTEEHCAMLRRQIEELEALVQKSDPDGLTAVG